MKYLILLLFPTLLFAQPDLQGDWWRLAAADTTAFSTDTPDIEIPKCLVEGEMFQCRLVFSKPIYDRSLFSGGTTATRAYQLTFELVVEPFNPKYSTGTVMIEIGQIIRIPVLYLDTGVSIVALCNVSLVQQMIDDTYVFGAFESCGDDMIVPVVEQFTEPLAPADFILNTIPTAINADDTN